MYTKSLFASIALAASFASTALGHALITQAKGANGVVGVGFGVVDGTPRDTDRPTRTTQQDSSIIRDEEIASGEAEACGRTKLNGSNDITAELEAADSAGLPTTDASGTLSMTIHQVNGDGAGPFTCDVSADGGQTFVAATVGTNVPGKNSRSRNKATDFLVTATVPAGMTCAGGPSENACVMRCRNAARAGPFGGCVGFTMGDAGAAAGNATATGNATAAATAERRVLKSRIVGENAGAWVPV